MRRLSSGRAKYYNSVLRERRRKSHIYYYDGDGREKLFLHNTDIIKIYYSYTCTLTITFTCCAALSANLNNRSIVLAIFNTIDNQQLINLHFLYNIVYAREFPKYVMRQLTKNALRWNCGFIVLYRWFSFKTSLACISISLF